MKFHPIFVPLKLFGIMFVAALWRTTMIIDPSALHLCFFGAGYDLIENEIEFFWHYAYPPSSRIWAVFLSVRQQAIICWRILFISSVLPMREATSYSASKHSMLVKQVIAPFMRSRVCLFITG